MHKSHIIFLKAKDGQKNHFRELVLNIHIHEASVQFAKFITSIRMLEFIGAYVHGFYIWKKENGKRVCFKKV